ncbi:MAG: hypothetical protein Q7J28_09805 [Caulobacter sp.]|nr:hypothetical protein [Caulobacter sp.]
MLPAMSGPGLFAVVVIGLLAGVLARALLGGRRSMFACLGLGLAGALAGSTVADLLGLHVSGVAAVAATALTGATALLAAARLMPKR